MLARARSTHNTGMASLPHGGTRRYVRSDGLSDHDAVDVRHHQAEALRNRAEGAPEAPGSVPRRACG